MPDCIFCQIVKGEIPCYKVYEDGSVLAFLDINPLAKGHALVIPKRHYENIFDIENEVLEKVVAAAKKLAQRMKEGLRADGINLVNSSGEAAEQSVPHFHLHLIPRKIGDEIDINAWWQTKVKKIDKEGLKELAAKIKNI